MNNYFLVLTSGAALLMAFLLISERKNAKGNFFLALFAISFLFLFIEETFTIIGKPITNEPLLQFINIFTFTVAPFFYLSVSYFVNPEKKWHNRSILHFALPGLQLLVTILSIWEYFCGITVSTEPEAEMESVTLLIIKALLALQILTYCIASAMRINQHQRNIREIMSDVEGRELQWLQRFTYAVIVMACIWIIDLFWGKPSQNYLFINFLYLVGIIFLAFHAIKQRDIFPFSVAEKNTITKIISEDITPKKTVPDEKILAVKGLVLEAMQTHKMYLDPELSLISLSKSIGVPSHQLSYILNQFLNENFFNFVNRYRIEHAKQMLADTESDKFSVLGIAYESGFNSKSVFNTTFKKYTGETPSSYKKKVAINNADTSKDVG